MMEIIKIMKWLNDDRVMTVLRIVESVCYFLHPNDIYWFQKYVQIAHNYVYLPRFAYLCDCLAAIQRFKSEIAWRQFNFSTLKWQIEVFVHLHIYWNYWKINKTEASSFHYEFKCEFSSILIEKNSIGRASHWLVHDYSFFFLLLFKYAKTIWCERYSSVWLWECMHAAQREIDAPVFSKNLNSYKIIIHAISLKCTNAPESNRLEREREKEAERATELCVAPGFFTWPVHLHNHCRPHKPTHSNQIGQAPSFYLFHNLLHRPNVKQQQGIFSICLFQCVCVFPRNVASWMCVRCDSIKCLISIHQL